MPDDPDLSRGRFYITTAIPYVNARPHLGFAMEAIQTDAFARYRRLKGDEVWFLSGADENSLSNVRAAEKEGIETSVLVERNAKVFESLRETLDISFDDFIRTSVERRHIDGATKLWEACLATGDIYKKPYRGLYCIGCEQFYDEDELIEGLCPEHATKPELIEEENYFFRLSAYAERLEKLIDSDELRVVPQHRKNEVLSFIRMGVKDFSVSRSVSRAHGWGVPIPGDPDQVMYVWFDALSNYINALGFAEETDMYRRFWVDNHNKMHVIGKGIIRFHAVYWPAMLISAGIPLPETIFVHGYVTVEGTKMSKSLGNVVDPIALAAQYTSDAVRYFLLRRVHPTDDANFTVENFINAFNSDLADQLGNLLSRVVAMVGRYYDGVVPAPGASDPLDETLLKDAKILSRKLDDAMNRFSPQAAMNAVWDLVSEANRYVVETTPWKIAKQRDLDDNETRLATVLYNLIEVLRLVCWACAAFVPRTAVLLAEQLAIEPPDSGADAVSDLQAQLAWGKYPPGTRLAPAGVLFPKIEVPPQSASAPPSDPA